MTMRRIQFLIITDLIHRWTTYDINLTYSTPKWKWALLLLYFYSFNGSARTSANNLMLFAAFISLSWTSLQIGQSHCLSDNFKSSLIYPHLLHVLLDGSYFPMVNKFFPLS